MAAVNVIFHKATIGGRDFYVTFVGDGPYVAEKDGKGLAIGRGTSIIPLPDRNSGKSPAWAVSRPRNKVEIDLSGFTEAEIKRFSKEFGVPFEGMDFELTFRQSIAFASLVKWAKKHPTSFERYGAAGENISWTMMVKEALTKERDAERVAFSMRD